MSFMNANFGPQAAGTQSSYGAFKDRNEQQVAPGSGEERRPIKTWGFPQFTWPDCAK
jgi:hypothetical protein